MSGWSKTSFQQGCAESYSLPFIARCRCRILYWLLITIWLEFNFWEGYQYVVASTKGLKIAENYLFFCFCFLFFFVFVNLNFCKRVNLKLGTGSAFHRWHSSLRGPPRLCADRAMLRRHLGAISSHSSCAKIPAGGSSDEMTNKLRLKRGGISFVLTMSSP